MKIKCLRCWLFGHEFLSRDYMEYKDSTGQRHAKTTYTLLTHCKRCAESAPPIRPQTAAIPPREDGKE